MTSTMGHGDGPERAPTALTEYLMFLETTDGCRYQPVTYILLALFNRDGLFREFC
jgi:hypothetical protein